MVLPKTGGMVRCFRDPIKLYQRLRLPSEGAHAHQRVGSSDSRRHYTSACRSFSGMGSDVSSRIRAVDAIKTIGHSFREQA